MKKLSIITIVAAIIFSFLISSDLLAQQQQTQQKITTPPLKLSKEEEKRLPEGDAPAEGMAAGGTVQPKKPDAFAPTMIKSASKIELILDASGSMNGLMGQTTKLAILKSVAEDIITQPLPEGTDRSVGLRVYGAGKPVTDNDCKDTSLLVPIGTADEKLFQAKVNSITAQGVSPIGFALQEAEKDFQAGPHVDNIIILVTDGADSCSADVCALAKELHSGAKKIMVNVVGFDLDTASKQALECVAKESDGQFTLARNESELLASIDQLMMANVPYNLRLKVLAGTTPLSASIKVYKAGSRRPVKEETTTGIKYLQLPPGTYDVEVTYTDSIEKPAPTKLIKNVEVQATSKAEQAVQFDLGILNVSATDQDGTPVAAKYYIRKTGAAKVEASFEGTAEPYMLYLTAGSYDIDVKASTSQGFALSASAIGLQVKEGSATDHKFEFQAGKVMLTAYDPKKNKLPFSYVITPAGDSEKKKPSISGEATAEGRAVDLPPGKYNIEVSLIVENLQELPSMTLDNIEVKAGDYLVNDFEIPTATLVLTGKDEKGAATETLFTVKMNGSLKDPAQFVYSAEPMQVTLPPGRYDITATYVKSDFEPKPVITWEAVALSSNQVLNQEAFFKFGILKVIGQNAKGAPLDTNFNIFRPSAKEPLITLTKIMSETDIRVTEGFYDIQAIDMTSRKEPKPNLWFHNIEIKMNAPQKIQAIFTNGILKMICKGPNNISLTCDYKVYTYGTDSPVLKGVTEDSWEEFDIMPGNYYIEAGYHDDVDEVLLKKWITFSVTDNDIVEQIIRF